LQPCQLDLRDSLADSVQSVTSFANDKDISIVAKSTDIELPVFGDHTRLQQIQANLLTNAIKYSKPGQIVKISLSLNDDKAVIRVTDQGAGIPKRQLDKIFDMFYQSDETLHRAHGGIGVGLSLVRSLVELHDGTISVQSDGIGKGSQFEVQLPLSKCDDKTLGPLNSETKSSGRIKTVAIVEDQEDNREMVSSMLEMEGFQVLSAENGVKGLQLIRTSKPDAAIVDLGLPELNGFEVARQLRNGADDHEPYDAILIALTGYGQPQDNS
jgi:two-component system CheB/CheR fusion protein